VRLPDARSPNLAGEREIRVRLLLCTTIVTAALLAPGVGSAAARPSGVIRTGPNGVTAMGPWQVSRDSTFPAAVRALGAASFKLWFGGAGD